MYKESDRVEKKEWLATMDDRTRESHADLNGEVRELDKDFSNGLAYPGEPSGDPEEIINCRCTILPVFEQERKVEAPKVRIKQAPKPDERIDIKELIDEKVNSKVEQEIENIKKQIDEALKE